MARTSQTARKRRRPRPPRNPIHRFKDHAGNEYTVVDPSPDGPPPHVTTKLGLHLYTLGPLSPNAEEIGRNLLNSRDIWDWGGNGANRWPRVDVYAPLDSIEACVDHHHREKAHRKSAKEEMHRAVATAAATPEEAQAAVAKLRGKEPLPHIVPSWRERDDILRTSYLSYQWYRSFILVVPEGSSSWEDVQERGLWMVEFDQDIPVELDTKEKLYNEGKDSLLEGETEWVYVRKVNYGPPVKVTQVGFNLEHQLYRNPMTPFYRKWSEYYIVLWDCTYRPIVCDGCDDDLSDHECEVELSEHVFNEQGKCIECSKP